MCKLKPLMHLIWGRAWEWGKNGLETFGDMATPPDLRIPAHAQLAVTFLPSIVTVIVMVW